MRQSDALAEVLLMRLRTANLPVLLVSKYTKAKPGTIGDWLGKGQPPRGERLNRLQHMLAILGIDSPELELVTRYGQYIGRLMAFDLITLAEAQSILGVGYEQAVYLTIRGDRNPLDEDVENKPTMTLEDLVERYSVRLAEAEAELRRSFADTTAGTTATAHATIRPLVSLPSGDDAGSARIRFLVETASTLAGIAPLVRFLLSDDCTSEERAFVRELLGEEGVFDLSNLMHRLCSERANNTIGG